MLVPTPAPSGFTVSAKKNFIFILQDNSLNALYRTLPFPRQSNFTGMLNER